MAGGFGGYFINIIAGKLFTFAAGSFKYNDTVYELSRDAIARAFLPADVTLKAGANAGDIVNAIQAAGQQVPQVIETASRIGTSAQDLAAAVANAGAQVISQPWAQFGYVGKPAGYMAVFCFCGIAYLLAWFLMKTLVPKYSPIKEED